MSDDGRSAEISIYDEIGAWGITAKDFQDELKALGPVADIALRINSPGGDVFDGLAIYNMLRRHKARVSVTVDGIAASMASVVAMAGDDVVMPENAMLMVHDPSGVVIGTSKEMRELADALDKIKQSLISAYAAKSGAERDEIGRLMAEETWLTADEAVELGLADGIEAPLRMAANFDLSRFRHPPTGLTARSNREERRMTGTRNQSRQQPDEPAEAPQQPGRESAAEQQQPERQPPSQQPAQPSAPAPSADRDAIVAEERTRSTDIMAACSLVGRHDLAAGFIAEGKSLGDVVTALQQQRADGAARGAEIVTHNAGGGGQQEAPLRVDLAADMRRRAGLKEG